MKYYAEGTHLKNPKDLEKNNLKEKLKPVLFNCLKEFNIKIKEWHYFFCIYLNHKDNNSYNKTLVYNCNQNDIEYIFFDSNEKEFYDRNLNQINNKLQLTFRSNLDCFSSSNPYIIFKNDRLLEKYSLQRTLTSNKLYEDTIFNIQKSEIINRLEEIIDVNFIAICKFNYDFNYPFPTPEKNYLLLFESKNEDDYIYYYNKDNDNFICGEIFNNMKYNVGLISSYIKNNKSNDIEFYVLKSEIKEKTKDK